MSGNTASIITVARHRIHTDGEGVTSLVCFHGCPLRCKYCINPFSFEDGTKFEDMTPQALYERTRVDELYFLATGGGVTFGGGEPLLYSSFINEFRNICGEEWKIYIETSLAVPWENVKTAAQVADMFIVDVKDTDPDIYRRYTGKENAQVLENIERLLKAVSPERVIFRIPRISGYNTDADRSRSQAYIRKVGGTRFDLFEYRTKNT